MPSKAAVRERTETPVKDDSGKALYWVRWPAEYWGTVCDRGQVVATIPMDADHKLLRLKYLVPVLETDRPVACRVCGERFLDGNFLNAHGDKQHVSTKKTKPNVPYSPRGATVDTNAADVQALEKEQQRAASESPLDLDKTTAARR